MKTTQMLSKELAGAEMVLNVDGTGGQLDPQGKPLYFSWSGAEKTYADFELTVTSPGRPQLASLRPQCDHRAFLHPGAPGPVQVQAGAE